MEQQVDYIVIGSGFGGSVSAMRLAEKGYSVVVLEAGKRWRPEDFPKTNWNVRKFFWAPGLGCYGIQRLNLLRDFMGLNGAGVGGGSLVYACVLIEPLAPFYKDAQWAHLDTDWQATLKPHYQEARRMLGVAKTPKMWEGDKLLKEYAEEIGRGHTFDTTEVGIFFGDEPGKTVPDPYFNGEGPERTSCDFSAACMIGCRSGGKNTLDKNYLYFAEKLGAKIVPETVVTAVKPDGEGGYEVHSKKGTALLTHNRRIWRAKNVVFSAGTLGTLDLLHRCKDKKWLPDISDRLGYKFRTNSEVLTGTETRDKDRNFAEGVAIGSIVQVNDHTSIELVRYNRGSDVMAGLTSLMVGAGSRITRPLKFFWKCLTHPIDFIRVTIWPGWAKRTMIYLVMQVLDNSLQIAYGRSWLRPWKKVIKSRTPEGGIPTYIPEANDCAQSVAKKINGIAVGAISEVMLNRPLTAHTLGGCPMGKDATQGVVDKSGKLFGYEGLYVADGSIVSANLGANPSLTITAISEYVMSQVPQKNK